MGSEGEEEDHKRRKMIGDREKEKERRIKSRKKESNRISFIALNGQKIKKRRMKRKVSFHGREPKFILLVSPSLSLFPS